MRPQAHRIVYRWSPVRAINYSAYRVEGDFGIQHLRHRAAGFGFLNDFIEFGIIDAQQRNGAVEGNFSDGEAVALFVQ
ncbi:hypothetical protein E05_42470 [Plautia stali symbiont]|nr:hypothetical protein E05_42470 [Plautia stali symbiont]